MNFTSVRFITTDFERLASFYETVSGQQLVRVTSNFGELRTVWGSLAIGDTNTLAPFGGELVASPAAKRMAIIELRVADVNADYQLLATYLGDALVQGPTTMPWGNRSLLFRNPDGNLVNFFMPLTPAALEKFTHQPA